MTDPEGWRQIEVAGRRGAAGLTVLRDAAANAKTQNDDLRTLTARIAARWAALRDRLSD